MALEHPGSDKPWMAAGPSPGDPNATNVYIAYNYNDVTMGVLASYDMGDMWTFAALWITQEEQGIGALPRVGPNGELYVAYWDPGTQVMLRRSFDGAQTFDPPITIAARTVEWSIPDLGPDASIPGTFRIFPFTYLAVDSNDGTLYCVYFDVTNVVNGNDNVDLYLTKSTDQGATWATPWVINGDPNPPGDQFFPWLEVDEQGNLHVVFLDSSNAVQDDDDEDAMLDAYYAFSSDGGVTWQEYRLTPASFNSTE